MWTTLAAKGSTGNSDKYGQSFIHANERSLELSGINTRFHQLRVGLLTTIKTLYHGRTVQLHFRPTNISMLQYGRA